MPMLQTILSGWRRFFKGLAVAPQRHTPTEVLSDAYRTEVALATLCTQHAQRMYYPQFRTELLRIAAEVEAHLP